MELRECRKRLERIENQKGRQPDLRREYNRCVRGGGDVDRLSKAMDKMWQPTFTEEEYESGSGFQTAVWGPAAWLFLHMTSLNYRPERKEAYEMLLNGYAGTLPCVHCRNNFAKNLEAASKAMASQGFADVWESRESYSRWIYELHHSVNVMLGKCTRNEPSYEQMRDELEMFRSRCLTPEEVEAEKKKKKEGGCIDSPYGADAKSKLVLTFVKRSDEDLKKVGSLNIDPKCRVRKR